MKTPTLVLSLILPALAASFAQTPADQLTVPLGFKVELLKAATKQEGSWISMAVDAKGRLYISPQGAIPESGFAKESQWGGLWRVTLAEEQSAIRRGGGARDNGRPENGRANPQSAIVKWEKVPVPVGDSMGMLWAFGSLYVSGQGPDGRGIYRVKDTNGDDTLDSATLWKAVPGGNGEHGAHALVLGPDGKSIYIAHGNSTPLIEGVDPNSPYRNYGEDILIPRVMDPVATFFDKLKIPYGHVLRTDENGTKWELIAGGFRNHYDIDFNSDGELFTYDSDMEWDVGLPWYRPTRVLHVVPGGDYGFREGNQKWPEYYADSLPAAVNIGLGSPTGVKFGTKSNFPEKYRRAFFIMDWTFGRLLAVHLHPKGASYTANNPLKSHTYPRGAEASEDVEVFLSGKGMPLTDLEFGKDGAMYFTVGGRGTQAGLYRVSYVGPEQKTEPKTLTAEELAASSARDYRRELESAHEGLPDQLSSDRSGEMVRAAEKNDRFIYFAARLRAEKLPPDGLLKLALEAPNVHAPDGTGGLLPQILGAEVKSPERVRALDGLMGLLALARIGEKSSQPDLLKALAAFPLDSLDENLKLLKLRVIKVSLTRQGRPADELVNLAIEKLGRQYPAKSWPLNRALSELLIWLGAPDAVEKTLALLEAAPTQEEQIWYACMLREAEGWTPPQRERYFAWFPKAGTYHGGNSFKKFIERIKEQALAKVPDAERGALAELASKAPPPAATAQPAVVRQFQKAWTMADLEPDLPKASSGRNFARGKEIFASTQCLACHHFGPEGGNVGPDLTAVGSRFQRRDILEAIIEPSKVVSEQYASFLFTMKNGDVIVGQIANETNFYWDVVVDPIRDVRQQASKTNLKTKELNPVSLMPPGLLYVLSKEEILDLLAYLESGGNEKAPAFSK